MTAAPPRAVRIEGDGVAAACAARLLGASGLAVTRGGPARRPVPVVMLSAPALALIRDVAGLPDLFAGLPRIERRVVQWGTAEPVAMPHSAVAVPESALLDALRIDGGAGAAEFTIRSATGEDQAQRRFGSRSAWSAEVRLRDAGDGSACWIEAVGEGWLFLVPDAFGRAWLLGVGGDCDILLRASRLVAPRVELVAAPAAAFDTAPRIATPLAGTDWLACGSAALGLDPICGDGAASAAREAILAAAVIAGIAEGEPAAPLLAHYEAMLVAALRRHLALCADFYRSGGEGAWWRAQSAALAEGHAWCTARLAATPEPRYRLYGFRLRPLERAA